MVEESWDNFNNGNTSLTRFENQKSKYENSREIPIIKQMIKDEVFQEIIKRVYKNHDSKAMDILIKAKQNVNNNLNTNNKIMLIDPDQILS